MHAFPPDGGEFGAAVAMQVSDDFRQRARQGIVAAAAAAVAVAPREDLVPGPDAVRGPVRARGVRCIRCVQDIVDRHQPDGEPGQLVAGLRRQPRGEERRLKTHQRDQCGVHGQPELFEPDLQSRHAPQRGGACVRYGDDLPGRVAVRSRSVHTVRLRPALMRVPVLRSFSARTRAGRTSLSWRLAPPRLPSASRRASGPQRVGPTARWDGSASSRHPRR